MDAEAGRGTSDLAKIGSHCMKAAATSHQREMTLRGLNTAWLEAGPSDDASRPIVLFLHGFPDAPESWDGQFEGLKGRYQLIAPYMRGVGPSEKADSVRRYGPDSTALDVLAILDEIDPERLRKIFIVGHDVGCVHAWHIAHALQKRVAGLVVVNGLSIAQMLRRLTKPRQFLKSWYMYALQVPVVPEGLFSRFSDRLVNLAHKQGGLEKSKRIDAEHLRGSLTGSLNQYRAFLRLGAKSLLAPRRRLECPVLVIFGAKDAFLEPPSHAELERDARHLTVRILPGNHWLHLEDPEKFNRLLADFFARNEVAT